MKTSRQLLNAVLLRGMSPLLGILDGFSLLAALIYSHVLLEYPRFGLFPDSEPLISVATVGIILITQGVIFFVADLNTATESTTTLLRKHAPKLLISYFAIWIVLAVWCYITKFPLGRDVLALGVAVGLLFSLLWRYCFARLLRGRTGLFEPLRCAFIRPGPLSEALTELSEFKRLYQKIDLHGPEETLSQLKPNLLDALVFESDHIDNLAHSVGESVIGLKFKGVEVIDAGALFERLTGRIPLRYLEPVWFLRRKLFKDVRSQIYIRIKRIIDFVVAFVLLSLCLLPLLILCALIMLTSPGSPIFVQSRVGLNGKTFDVYKLRSMRINCSESPADWTSDGDPRITLVGSLIRKFRLDELPQLWNVLCGDMSLIGPRPEQPEIVSELRKNIPYYDLRHSVLPGLSGWAQVNQPKASPKEALLKLEYDLYYIVHLGFWLEFSILLKTFGVLLAGKAR